MIEYEDIKNNGEYFKCLNHVRMLGMSKQRFLSMVDWQKSHATGIK
jgi:hypothetical protein